MKTYITICGGNTTPVIIPTDESGDIPVFDIPMCSDYKWQLMALLDRIQNPAQYATIENVEETVAKLIHWLESHSPE